jgi:hypothetical protein
VCVRARVHARCVRGRACEKRSALGFRNQGLGGAKVRVRMDQTLSFASPKP